MSVRLSLMITNYNHGIYLEERISFILSEMSAEDELVIVDDGSTDNSVPIINMFLQIDSRVRLIVNERNQGVAHSLNIAAQATRGKYIACLASDDLMLPGYISKTLPQLLAHPEMGICCSDCASLYEDFPDKSPDKIYAAHLIADADKPLVFPPEKIVKVFWDTYFWIPGHTAIIKKECFFKYGAIRENLGYLCDWFLMHSIALNSGAIYIPETLAVWRVVRKSYSHRLGSDPTLSRPFQMKVFKTLSEKGNERLRQQFRKSGLLHPLIRPNLLQLAARPYYWDFLLTFVKRYLNFRLKKYMRLFCGAAAV